MMNLAKRALRYIKKQGILSGASRVKRYFNDKIAIKEYYKKEKITEEQIYQQRNTSFEYNPKISILIPLYKTPENFLKELISTIKNQTYSNWELCLADGTEKESNITYLCRELAESDSRIKYTFLGKNEGISENTNAALSMASGEFVMLVDHDDLLEINALYECVKVLNERQDIDSIYTDEDKTDQHGKKRFEPHFKPDYNIEYLRCGNYICHLFVTRKALAIEAGGFDSRYDGAQDYDFILKCTEKSRNIYHIPKILYHWRCHQDSTATRPESKAYAYDAGARALMKHYERCGIKAKVEPMENCLGYYKSQRIIDKSYNVTHICVTKTDYTLYDVKDINRMIKQSENEYILLYHGHIQRNRDDDIAGLMQYAADDAVGAVGARIYGADNKLIQGSIILGMNGFFDYSFKNAGKDDKGYFFRIVMPQNAMALDYRYIMIKKSLVEENGGLDESMPLGLAVIDYCLKTEKSGKRAVYNPYVTVKYEGKDKFQKYTENQKKNFVKIWNKEIAKGDKYFNRNFSMNSTEYIVK